MLDIKQKLLASLAISILFLFKLRVVSQFIQVVYPISFLPPFESWQSGLLPYPILFIFQILIIIWMSNQCLKVARGNIPPNAIKSRILLWLGGAYFLIMLTRLIGGLTILSQHYWFNAKLPTFFHLILSIFLLILSGIYSRKQR